MGRGNAKKISLAGNKDTFIVSAAAVKCLSQKQKQRKKYMEIKINPFLNTL